MQAEGQKESQIVPTSSMSYFPGPVAKVVGWPAALYLLGILEAHAMTTSITK